MRKIRIRENQRVLLVGIQTNEMDHDEMEASLVELTRLVQTSRGNIVVKTYQVLRYTEMYTGIMAMSLLGVLLYFALNTLERQVSPHLYLEEG